MYENIISKMQRAIVTFVKMSQFHSMQTAPIDKIALSFSNK